MIGKCFEQNELCNGLMIGIPITEKNSMLNLVHMKLIITNYLQ